MLYEVITSKYTMEDFGINNLQSEIMLTRILEADADVKAMIFAHDIVITSYSIHYTKLYDIINN